jgi:hypothetical protein
MRTVYVVSMYRCELVYLLCFCGEMKWGTVDGRKHMGESTQGNPNHGNVGRGTKEG